MTVPCALVGQSAGGALKALQALGNRVVGTLSWRDVVPHSAPVVDWEFWTNSNDECGLKCTRQQQLLADLSPVITSLLRARVMTFTPHYITLQCGDNAETDFCRKQCINGGRYCQQDPDGSLDSGYSGADVVRDNLQSLCVFRTVNATGEPWLWWQYATAAGRECSMLHATYNAACAIGVATRLGVSPSAVAACVGDPTRDAPNDLLEGEKRAMLSNGRRGDVSLFPTLIANGVQFRGDLDNVTVMQFLCAAYPAGGAPAVCSSRGMAPSSAGGACAPGGFGAQACAARSDGATRCLEQATAPYWSCSCPVGSTFATGADGTTKCTSSNPCVTRAAGMCVAPQSSWRARTTG